MAAAVETAFADIIDWLATHPEDCTSIEALATALGDEVVDELIKGLAPEQRLTRRQEIAEHFWCSLLAAFADALQRLQTQLDKVPEAVIDFLLERKDSTAWAKLPDAAVRAGVHAAWKAMKHLAFFDQYARLLRTVRILAIAICPCPETHRDVFEYCLKPLLADTIKPIIRQETVRRLEIALPPGWI